jgi:hypothetical protein
MNTTAMKEIISLDEKVCAKPVNAKLRKEPIRKVGRHRRHP